MANPKYFAYSVLFSSVGVLFSYWIYPSQTCILGLTFTVVGLASLFLKAIQQEEKLIAESAHKNFFARHSFILRLYIWIALGVLSSLIVWYNLLPDECGGTLPCKETVFKLQLQSLNTDYETKFLVNFGLMLLCFLLALFFGVGMLLILFWDLSLLVVTMFNSDFSSIIRMAPTSIAFFFIGLSGALVSTAIAIHEWRSHHFMRVIKDAIELAILAFVIFILGFIFL
jgi:hypothetical protein